jgi:hypothetical protein
MSETPQAESSSAPAQSAALKNEAKRWEGWPKNCTNFRPGLDDPHELQQIFTRFEENKPPISPSEWQVFHINEYEKSGKGRKGFFMTLRTLFNAPLNRIDKPQGERKAARQSLGNYVTSTTAGPRIPQEGGFWRGDRTGSISLSVSIPSVVSFFRD